MTGHPGIEEYLEAIYRLTDGDTGRHTTTSALSAQLGVSAPSVSEMLRRMGEAGLVVYKRYGGASLTATGLAQATSILRYHRLWERFLVDRLGMPWDQVHHEACRLEHATSPQVAERLAELLDHPQTCPHGNEVPAPGTGPVALDRALADQEAGFSGEIASIRESPEMLRYCAGSGLVPGSGVSVLSVDGIDRLMQVQVSESPGGGGWRQLTIGPRAAGAIRVRPARSEQEDTERGFKDDGSGRDVD